MQRCDGDLALAHLYAVHGDLLKYKLCGRSQNHLCNR